MQKLYKPFRVGLLFTVLAVMMALFVLTLYRLQIVDAQAAGDGLPPVSFTSRNVTTVAARGNIYDRNGVLLVSGRPALNITLDWTQLAGPNSPNSPARRNEIILDLIYDTLDAGLSYTDTFPVTPGPPFEFLTDMTATQRRRLDRYIEFHWRSLNPDITASELLDWMRRHYQIDYTIGINDARLIMGVRYELEIRRIIGDIPPYTFAYDVPHDLVASLAERNKHGVNIENTFVRKYHTPYAAHLLGYVGSITEAMFERFVTELGYPMDAIVGRAGAELAFEEYLRGIAGQKTVITNIYGTVTDVFVEREPVPGNHVFLSIDIGQQQLAEHALRDHIYRLNNDPYRSELDRIPGGAVVVTDVRTGEVLASASYPTFDLATRTENFAALSQDPNRPMFNRATMGIYSPGSTFKMVTAFTALREGTATRWSQISCTGLYRIAAPGTDEIIFTARCWILPVAGVGHGSLNVVESLAHSCNYFFFETMARIPGHAFEAGYAMGEASREFGLGVPTGIQIGESTGRVGDPAFKREWYTDPNQHGWWLADTAVTAFGQGYNMFTPVQLATYTATIANDGVRNALTLLSRVRSNDLSQVIYAHTPYVQHVIEETDYISYLQAGMVGASNWGTARSMFADYRIQVASKTGTVQRTYEDVNTGLFVAYAPANNPEIAIAIVVERGGSGAAIMGIARDIFDYYFAEARRFPVMAYGDLRP
ncbi:MAG: penicillin-binding transpeptidase domain-containing protein [Oscillospiraceae bacterium]|nr:penicillin-binding transpeptidase domain-containing protein [Oscillospiraceae bacterium]